MMQEINFYTLLPKPARYQLTVMRALRITGGFAALLLIIYLFNLLIYFAQTHKLSTLQQNQQLLQQQLTQLTQQYESNAINNPLLRQNRQLTAELQSKQHLLVTLKQTTPDNYIGYANYLSVFASTINPGVWLTTITLLQTAQHVELSGSAINSAAIMQFIQDLGKGLLFQGKTFNVIRLENAKENPLYINFTLSTQARVQNANSTGKIP